MFHTHTQHYFFLFYLPPFFLLFSPSITLVLIFSTFSETNNGYGVTTIGFIPKLMIVFSFFTDFILPFGYVDWNTLTQVCGEGERGDTSCRIKTKMQNVTVSLNTMKRNV